MRDILVTLAVAVESARLRLRLLSEGCERLRIAPHYPKLAGPKSRQLLAGSVETLPSNARHKRALGIAGGTPAQKTLLRVCRRQIRVRQDDI